MCPDPLALAAQRHINKILIGTQCVKCIGDVLEIVVPPQGELLTGTHDACLQSKRPKISTQASPSPYHSCLPRTPDARRVLFTEN